jgi:6-phosphogluconate dehydrogenase (decarboxylating)
MPNDVQLANYAKLLVDFALGGTYGIESGDSVMIGLPEAASAFLLPLQTAISTQVEHQRSM